MGQQFCSRHYQTQAYGSSMMMVCLFVLCRLVFRGMSISRPNAVVGKCRMIRHSRDKKNEPNPQRYVLCSIIFLLPPLGWAGCRNETLERALCLEGLEWVSPWGVVAGAMKYKHLIVFFLRFLFYTNPACPFFFFLVDLTESHIRRRQCSLMV